MKSEHRHELKTNDLAKSILTAGDYVRLYGGRVALGLAIGALVVVLIMQRVGRSRATQAALPGQLAQVRQVIDRLSAQQLTPNDREVTDPKEGALAVLGTVKDNATDDALKAEALAAEGDINWTIATYATGPGVGATSQPVTVTDAQRAEAAGAAKGAYQQIVDKYPGQTLAVVTARFGLAALAENGRDWAGARQQYEAVKGLAGAAAVYKQIAEGKLAYLELIQRPVLIGQVPDVAEPARAPLDPADVTEPHVDPAATKATSKATSTSAPASGPSSAPSGTTKATTVPVPTTTTTVPAPKVGK